jgi:hypothetical protein
VVIARVVVASLVRLRRNHCPWRPPASTSNLPEVVSANLAESVEVASAILAESTDVSAAIGSATVPRATLIGEIGGRNGGQVGDCTLGV